MLEAMASHTVVGFPDPKLKLPVDYLGQVDGLRDHVQTRAGGRGNRGHDVHAQPPNPRERFDAALSKLKPDLAKLVRDKASQKKKGTGYRNRLLAEVAEAREAQAVERQAPAVRVGAGPRRSARGSRTEVVHKR